MTDQFTLASRWGDRPESASECAERLSSFLSELAALHSSLSEWYGLVGDDEEAVPESWPLRPGAAELERFVLACREGADLGFRLPVLSDTPDMALDIHCGGTSGVPRVENGVFLHFREPAGTTLERLGLDVVRGLVTAAVEAWEPEWATFISDSAWEAQRGYAHPRPVGLVTYRTGSVEEALAEFPDLAVEAMANGSVLTRPPSV
ncbi:Imm52 family immunity protein [Streptomyces sp. NPDC050416]|uniref:Imm52 family immunity protein n=1 Tax=Streptomyces sp. NPDC050416 TaxID=3365611 RepID=UPI0037947A4D